MATGKRLIDAMNTVTKISKRVTPQIAQGCHQQRVYTEVLQVIAEAPTVDAVEVVRCKDCKHYVLHDLACRHENFNGIIPMNGYCYYGERKSDATD